MIEFLLSLLLSVALFFVYAFYYHRNEKRYIFFYNKCKRYVPKWILKKLSIQEALIEEGTQPSSCRKICDSSKTEEKENTSVQQETEKKEANTPPVKQEETKENNETVSEQQGEKKEIPPVVYIKPVFNIVYDKAELDEGDITDLANYVVHFGESIRKDDKQEDENTSPVEQETENKANADKIYVILKSIVFNDLTIVNYK